MNPEIKKKKVTEFYTTKISFSKYVGTIYVHSSAFAFATYLRLDVKFHARTCTCADSVDKSQVKTLAFVRVAMFLFQDFLAYPTTSENYNDLVIDIYAII